MNTGKKNIYSKLFRMNIGRISVLFATGLLMVLSAFIVIVILCGSTIYIFPFSYAGIVYASLSILLCTLLAFFRILRPICLVTYTSTARIVEHFYPHLDNSLVNTLYFTNSKNTINDHYSQPLITQITLETTQKLKKVNSFLVLPYRKFLLECLKCLILFMLLLGVQHFSPAFIPDALASIFHPVEFLNMVKNREIKKNIVLPPHPVIGDIELTYTYPAYIGEPPFTLKQTGGDIIAYKGSVITVAARVNQDVASASLKAGKNMITKMAVKNKRFVKGTLTIFEESSYYINVINDTDQKNSNPIVHAIKILDDTYPQIILNFPEDMIEVKVVDRVELIYEYSDDIGISGIKLVYEVFDKEGLKKKSGKILTGVPPKKKGQGKYVWDLSLLNLQEGGQIQYSLEILDNDTVSGPKLSSTQNYFLVLYDSEKGHNDMIFSQEKIFEDMLLVLADKLTNRLGRPISKQNIINTIVKEGKTDEALDKVFVAIDLLLEKLKNDPLSDPSTHLAYKTIKNRLVTINNEKKEKFKWLKNEMASVDKRKIDFVSTFKDREIDEIERDIIEFDRLIKVEKLQNLMQKEDDIMAVSDSLYDLISNLSEMGKDEALMEFREKMKKMEEFLKEFMEKMMSMSKELPDEFVNSEAFSKMDDKEMLNSMDEIKKALKEGDLDKAAQLASQFLSEMENMLQHLLSSFGELTESELFADMGKINDALDTVGEMLKKEKSLLENSRGIDEALNASNKETKQKGDAFRKKIENMSSALLSKLDKVQKKANDHMMYNGITRNALHRIKKDIASMVRYLKSDLPVSGIFSQQVLKKLKKYKDTVGIMKNSTQRSNGEKLLKKTAEAAKISEQIVSEFKNLFSKKGGGLTPRQIKEMIRMAKRQNNILNDANGLKKSIQGFGGVEALLGSDIFHKIDDSISGMEMAKTGLENGKINPSISGENDAVNSLLKVKDGLKGLKENVEGMMKASGKSKFGMGQMPGMRIQGKTIKGKVDIPSEQEYTVPKKFREDILKAMQRKSPLPYKEMNRKYYNKLIK